MVCSSKLHRSLNPTCPKNVFSALYFEEVPMHTTRQRAISMFALNIQSITLVFCEEVDSKVIQTLLRCTNLVELNLIEDVGNAEPLRCVLDSNILQKLPHLETLGLRGCIREYTHVCPGVAKFFNEARKRKIDLDIGECWFPDCEYVGEKCFDCSRILCMNCFPYALCRLCLKNFCYDCVTVDTCEVCFKDYCDRCRRVTYCLLCDRNCCEDCDTRFQCGMSSQFFDSNHY